MKFSINALRQYLDLAHDTSYSIEAIANRLTMIGIEVEGIEDLSKKLAPFKIVKLVAVRKHPKSEKLNICTVDQGDTKLPTLEIVCGAPNVYEGMISVLAPIGAVVESKNLTIAETDIAGVKSCGMLCSDAELETGLDGEGIIDLPKDAKLGGLYMDYVGLNDQIFEIKVTPNRGDALGVYGIARDLAASGMGKLQSRQAAPIKGEFTSPLKWRIEADAEGKNACEFVAGRYFKGVKNGPSPDWLQKRLLMIGHRPISALVDITNLMTFDMGRPLHVYDAKKVVGKELVMRMAKTGEDILALDGDVYALSPAITIISDDQAPQGIAGVIGGMASGCSLDTEEVFLEAALFTPSKVASAGRLLNLQSDARFRFERGIDTDSVKWGIEMASRLILELCGGSCSDVVSAGEMPAQKPWITLDMSRLRTYGGVDISVDETKRILTALGFTFGEEKLPKLQVRAPSWRPDIEFEACLIEEVLRIYGYDKIPAVSLHDDENLKAPSLSLSLYRRQLVSKTLNALGLHEMVSWSFLSIKDAAHFATINPALKIANPISSELDFMRPSLMPNLLMAVQKNAARGHYHLSLFEVGPVYHGVEPNQQAIQASGIRTGLKQGGRHWKLASDQQSAFDVFDAKQDVIAVLEGLGISPNQLEVKQEAPNYYHPGRSGSLYAAGKLMAFFGELHPKILKHYDQRNRAVGFEIFLDHIGIPPADQRSLNRKAVDLPIFQPLTRDFAFVVDEGVEAQSLLETVRKAEPLLIVDVRLFDVYAGKELEGKRSLAVQITLQPTLKSLNEDEINGICANIIAAVKTKIGAELRS